jgi:NAD-dependent dihydropyrimidine dehydrogenase PreA subunit
MPYVITEACIDTKDKSCVNVCPVDCIVGDAADRQLYINPEECIDCGACEPECPVSGIYADSEVPDNQKSFIAINRLYFKDNAAARAEVNKLYPGKRK